MTSIGGDIGSVQPVKLSNKIDYSSIWDTERVNYYNYCLQNNIKTDSENPYYMAKTGFRKGGLSFNYTEAEQIEFKKCSQDPVYFADKYCHSMTDDGISNVKLYNHQQRILNELYKYQMNVWVASRQSNKCLNFNSKVKIKYKNEEIEIPIGLLYLNNKEKLTILEKIKKFLFKFYCKIESKLENGRARE